MRITPLENNSIFDLVRIHPLTSLALSSQWRATSHKWRSSLDHPTPLNAVNCVAPVNTRARDLVYRSTETRRRGGRRRRRRRRRYNCTPRRRIGAGKRKGFRTTSVLRAIEFSQGILALPDRLASGKTATQRPQHTEAQGCEGGCAALGIGFLIGEEAGLDVTHLNFDLAFKFEWKAFATLAPLRCLRFIVPLLEASSRVPHRGASEFVAPCLARECQPRGIKPGGLINLEVGEIAGCGWYWISLLNYACRKDTLTLSYRHFACGACKRFGNFQNEPNRYRMSFKYRKIF